jgi:ribosomal protein L40E
MSRSPHSHFTCTACGSRTLRQFMERIMDLAEARPELKDVCPACYARIMRTNEDWYNRRVAHRPGYMAVLR